MKAWRAGEKETAKWVKGETAESVGRRRAESEGHTAMAQSITAISKC